jgi:hypothetical protein
LGHAQQATPAAAAVPVPAATRQATRAPNAVVGQAEIDSAVRATLAEEYGREQARGDRPIASATPGVRFSRAAPTRNEIFDAMMDQARLPDCLHADGLRNQPTFLLSGYLALPFIAVAKLRGVCR